MIEFLNYTASVSHTNLTIPYWKIKRGEQWAVLGNNGSGKTLITSVLTKQPLKSSGTLKLSSLKPGAVSFEKAEALLEEERKKDNSDFIDKEDPGTLVKDFLNLNNSFFPLEHLAERGLKYLSTGELRKVLILKELEKNPGFLILDEPWDGLDKSSRKDLNKLITMLQNRGLPVILILNRDEDIHKNVTHIAFMHKNRLTLQGPRDEILCSEAFNRVRHFSGTLPDTLPGMDKSEPLNVPPVIMKDVSISFGDNRVLNKINWKVDQGEHYKITGPNGSGKSTLLKIITGDSNQSYGQDITLFGRKRGTGESIWDIKRHTGSVSSSLQKEYRVSISLLGVILSGFYDSIGLYTHPTQEEKELALMWLDLAKLSDKKDMPFKELSYGEQRMGLILRAMVKHPAVLILDEPCLGLDPVNREMVLLLLETIAHSGNTTLLWVSHREEDFLSSIKRELKLLPGPEGSRAVISSLEEA